ncbi:hypothetical protein C2E20_0918 [Micractinium conductrix]|uniref:Uncharacterized protein n=1 Tax=Micractinium conductrix TaxID=554055 RepID=A0A2P6VRV3_9CHLO|nr:hypothetical protein C2E20_0918 [Micractinium conductrix]|eukprot:PSC76824.1 hypothetical protein C2E20_0918 [Micractinium conductrix]
MAGLPPQQPLVALAGAVSALLGRALGACLASGGPPDAHTVVLELQQGPHSPGLLGLRVWDDGVALPADQRQLERVAAALPPALAHPLFADGTLLVQTAAHEEAVVRRYSVRTAPGGAVDVLDCGATPKPPGAALRGSVFEAAVRLAEGAGDGRAPGAAPTFARDAHLLPCSAEEAVGCLQQLLGMLRVLAPPVRVLMRLNGVLLQAPDGSLRPATGSRRMDLELPAGLEPLARFGEGMAAEFLPAVAAAPPQGAAAEGPDSVLNAMQSSGSTDGEDEAQRAPGSRGAAGQADVAGGEAAHLAAPQQLTFVGVGEAGWGCGEATLQLRGCKWTARAGLVLSMPDHATLAAAGGAGGAGAAASQQQQQQQQPVPVFLFRGWAMQLEGQQQAVKGVEKLDWPAFGFSLVGAEPTPEGPISVALRCAQPASGAALTAAVVHLTPCDYSGAAAGKGLPALSASYEARLVKGALEGALRQLKAQCPAVVCSRRERSLARALPLLSQSLAGILLASERSEPYSTGGPAHHEGSVLQQACALVGCARAELEGGIAALLQGVVGAALSGEGGGDAE